jgi:hypothetical protein
LRMTTSKDDCCQTEKEQHPCISLLDPPIFSRQYYKILHLRRKLRQQHTW